MTLVVDASVAAKWVLDEGDSDRANALRQDDDLIAPALIAGEIGNALWKAVSFKILTLPDALAAIRNILIPFASIVPLEPLREPALQLAVELQHPIYDCFYIALAQRERVALVTADKRLLALRKKLKGVEIRGL
jgi:predicted nucleic acid-binding protein